MKKKTTVQPRRTISPGVVFAAGTAVPFLLYLTAYIVGGVYPFGDKLFLEADSFHQYLPFLTEFRRKLAAGESLFYSFSGGLGYNFWATIAYYTASPLNLMLLLIPEANVCDYMVWMTVLKTSISGGIFAWYLLKQENAEGLYPVAFGTMYALSNYMIGYKYNIMWLDSIAMVPLVMYGLEKMVREKTVRCYLFSLFYAIWCNFYIGYMVCIFSCLYLGFLFVTEEKADRTKMIGSLGRFIPSSLAAGGMAAVLLLPVFLALRESTAMVSGESAGLSFLNNGISMMRQLYMEADAFRISYTEGDVHLYCGTAVLFLATLYFSDSSVRKRERISYAVFLGFLLLSFTFRPLNFMWHGFHNQTGLPNRFSFFYILILLKMCYSVTRKLKQVEMKRLNRTVIGIFIITLLLAGWDMAAEHAFRISALSLGCLALYTVLLYEIRSGPGREKQFALILSILMTAEAGCHGIVDVSLAGDGWERSTTIGYQKDYQELIRGREEEGFFRSEIDTELSNLITYAGGQGVSLFNSTMQDHVCRFLGGMNLHSQLNMAVNTGGTKLAQDLLGVRYTVTENAEAEKWNGLEKVDSLNGKNLYYNPQALSIGFMVPEELLSWVPEPGNGMDGHNELARILCGMEEPYAVLKRFTSESGKPVSIEIPEESRLYVTLDPEERPNKIIWVTPEYAASYEKRFQYLLLPAEGTEESRQTAMIATTEDRKEYEGTAYICRQEDYEIVTEALSRNQMEDADISGNRISGTIRAADDGMLMMTVPYNRGWKIQVDGAAADYSEIGGALIGIPLTEGEHRIQMRFVPEGFAGGCVISGISILLAVMISEIEKKKQRKRP